MEKERAIELLIQAVDEIPHLKTLRYQNDEMKLWLDKVGNILRAGLKPEDYSKYWPVSQELEILKGVYEDNIYQEEYLRKITNYEIALKSIMQKYEILWTEGKRDKGGEVENMDAEKQKNIDELKDFYKKLRSYQNRQRRRLKEDTTEAKDRSLNALRLELQRTHGRLGEIISEYGGIRILPYLGREYEVFALALSSLDMRHNDFTALDSAIGLVNKTIGKLESTPISELEAKEVKSAVEESPLDIFDAMQFHPKVIVASESLFKTGNCASAIFEAFKAVHNYVQDKTGLTLDGANLMEKVFNENKPILQLNELLTPSDKNEQKGFKHIFIGSQIGIRNPKAHENVKQEDPTRTLEYLSIASLLMRRIDESKLVKLNI